MRRRKGRARVTALLLLPAFVSAPTRSGLEDKGLLASSRDNHPCRPVPEGPPTRPCSRAISNGSAAPVVELRRRVPAASSPPAWPSLEGNDENSGSLDAAAAS